MNSQNSDDAKLLPAAELLPLVYEQLRRQAELAMKHERDGHTLGATALLHEAYLRLVGSDGQATFANQAHFYAAIVEMMRRTLIDHARGRNAQKREGKYHRLTTLGDLAPSASHGNYSKILAVQEALLRLEKQDAQAASVVRLRFFGGRSTEQAAEALGVSPRTVRRQWQFARAWLFRQLEPE